MLRRNSSLHVFKNFLFISTVFLFWLLIFVKYRIFQLKANIRAIENDIRALERQKEVLNIELTYLTNPERLRKLYVEVKKLDVRTFEGKELVSIDQIKNIKTLIPYYYSKLEKYNGKNSVALK